MSTVPIARTTEVANGVFLIKDTCNVYLIVSHDEAGSRTAVAVDFGSGLALDVIESLGIERITDIVMTHHHRDQGQGLPRAVELGIPIHVPPVEVDLFSDVESMWSTRALENDYNLRQDRFSLLESVPVASTVPEYRTGTYGGIELRVVPTPGHTIGSVTYLLDRDGETIAFTGDLIYGPGKVWSLAASQWSYSNHEGPAMTILSCYLLADERPTTLLPSHGEPMRDALAALDLLALQMQSYVDSRRWYPWDLNDRLRYPWKQLTEHLLLNRSSLSCFYALLSDTGEALFIDFGYDVTTGLPTGNDRASRRPWLASIPSLKALYGVTAITAVLPTHYHDDHVAGMPLLRDVEGTEIWSPANVAPILADPWLHDLPCQWYDAIPSDRVLPLGESFTWNEYQITVHEQPGHTLYAAAFEVTVDGVTVLFTGDQQENLGIPGERREILNYQYRNGFRIADYRKSAELYKRVGPGLMVSGHWEPRWVDEGYLDYLVEEGQFVWDIHNALLPFEDYNFTADSIFVRLTPYRSDVTAGSTVRFSAFMRNPQFETVQASVKPIVPPGWDAPAELTRTLEAGEEVTFEFDVVVGGPVTRARVAVDVQAGEHLLGQAAEAIVTVRPTSR
ncbi:MAG: hypothetical protein JWP85_2253 [Rhodoglobus sp.]|nr:hypothetical protein [Rhodoglobus sp.]